MTVIERQHYVILKTIQYIASVVLFSCSNFKYE